MNTRQIMRMAEKMDLSKIMAGSDGGRASSTKARLQKKLQETKAKESGEGTVEPAIGTNVSSSAARKRRKNKVKKNP